MWKISFKIVKRKKVKKKRNLTKNGGLDGTVTATGALIGGGETERYL